MSFENRKSTFQNKRFDAAVKSRGNSTGFASNKRPAAGAAAASAPPSRKKQRDAAASASSIALNSDDDIILSEDEAAEKKVEDAADKKDAPATEVKAVRKQAKPRPKLTLDLLTGPKGLPRIVKEFPKLTAKFKGSGYEAQDLKLLMQSYREWAYHLFPNLPFEAVINRVEKFGSTRKLRGELINQRAKLLGEDAPYKDSSSDQLHPVPDESDMAPRYTDDSVYMGPMAIPRRVPDLAVPSAAPSASPAPPSAPSAPASLTQTSATASAGNNLEDYPDAEDDFVEIEPSFDVPSTPIPPAVSSTAAAAAAPAPSPLPSAHTPPQPALTPASTPSGLSEEQRRIVAEKRAAALAKLEAKKKEAQAQAPSAAVPRVAMPFGSVVRSRA